MNVGKVPSLYQEAVGDKRQQQSEMTLLTFVTSFNSYFLFKGQRLNIHFNLIQLQVEIVSVLIVRKEPGGRQTVISFYY